MRQGDYWRNVYIHEMEVEDDETIVEVEEDGDALVSGDYKYHVNDDGVSVTIDEYIGSGDVEIDIPSSIDDKPVTVIGEFAFGTEEGLAGELKLPSSLISIGAGAFSGCSSLSGELIIPDGVTSIGASAFDGCSRLTGNVTIPYGVTEVGFAAFRNCSGLVEVTLPENITEIQGETFKGCSNLTKVTIPNSVTVIGWEAFYDCSSLAGELIIPSGVTEIGKDAFYNCKGLSKVTIPESVLYIYENVFSQCENLETIVLNNVTLEGYDASLPLYYELPYTYYRSDGREITKLEYGVTYNETITKTRPTPTPTATPTVTPTPAPIVNPGFKVTKLYINKGAKVASNFDKAGTSGKVTYKSSNKNVATVDSKGKITAKGVGKAKITASFNNKKYTCTVSVYNPTISGKSEVKKGKTITLKVKDGYGKTTWKSSNTKIATVDKNGKVKGKKKGKVTITAKNNGKTVKKTISVK